MVTLETPAICSVPRRLPVALVVQDDVPYALFRSDAVVVQDDAPTACMIPEIVLDVPVVADAAP